MEKISTYFSTSPNRDNGIIVVLILQFVETCNYLYVYTQVIIENVVCHASTYMSQNIVGGN